MSSNMVEVAIDSIRVSLMSQQRIVILREMNADRFLPIWIGVYEAEAITLALQEVEIARPLTWDLLKNVFGLLNARVVRVEVIDLRDDTFFGNIVAEVDGRVLNIELATFRCAGPGSPLSRSYPGISTHHGFSRHHPGGGSPGEYNRETVRKSRAGSRRW